MNRNEPQPRRGRPKCPAWLDAPAKKRWRSLVPELDRLGLLTVVDGDALAGYCQAWAEFEHATRLLQQEGRVIKTGSGYPIAHPAVALQRSAWKAVKDFAALFGLDPSSRSRLQVPRSGQGGDESEQFLSEGKGRFSRDRYAEPDSSRQSVEN